MEVVKTSVSFEAAGNKSYSCIVEHEFPEFGLIGYGSTAREAEEDVFTELKELREIDKIDAPDIEITERKFDVGSFFSYYPFFNITALAKFAGINAAQVRQYASGIRKPTAQKKEQLNAVIHNIIEMLSQDSRAFRID